MEKDMFLQSNKQREDTNSILDFYDGTSVFITGVTGFVGKSVLEKILRTCKGVQAVYVLIRSKKGLKGDERLKAIFATPVFNKTMTSNPEVIDKVKVINGDLRCDNLNISSDDRCMLLNDVNIVLHTAATVSFTEPLKESITLNTIGTKNVLDLCKEMKNLKSFVHVSTVACVMKSVNQISEEKIYKPAYDPRVFCNLVQQLPPDVLQTIESKLIGDQPNTYTFSKFLTEALVEGYGLPKPIAIVRLPAVGASWKEPFPGWTETMKAMAGYVSEVGKGTLRSVICKGSTTMNLVPVDIAANTVIVSAWHCSIKRSNAPEVYNCTNGNINPLTFKKFFEYAMLYSRQFPSLKVLWYPNIKLTENKYVQWIKVNVLQFLLALLLETANIFSFNRSRKRGEAMFNYRRLIYMLHVIQFYMLHELNVEMKNMQRLVEDVKTARDGDKFNVDISKENGLLWDQYMKEYVLGTRKHFLKEDLSTLPKAKFRLKKLFWLHKLLAIGALGSVLVVIYLFLW